MAASNEDLQLKILAAQIALVKSIKDLVAQLKRERRRTGELHDHEHLGEDDL